MHERVRLLAFSLGFVAVACTAAATPTATPTPRPPVQGIRTPEDMRGKFEAWPEEYKFAIDDDVVVRFAYPSDFIDFGGAAFIDHIPSVSMVVLYTAFSAETRVLSSERRTSYHLPSTSTGWPK